MTVVIYALDILPFDPDKTDWSLWLDPGRVSSAARFRFKKDRARCIGAGLLLNYALQQHDCSYPLPPQVAKDSQGKPWLPELPDFHFNISHSGKWVVCAVGDRPIGVDIEQTERGMQEVAKRYFSAAEQNYLQSLANEKRSTAFIELWVLKESYMKATGLGLSQSLKDLQVVHIGPPATMEHKGQKVLYGLTLCEFTDPEYRLGLAVKNAASAPSYRIEQVGLDIG